MNRYFVKYAGAVVGQKERRKYLFTGFSGEEAEADAEVATLFNLLFMYNVWQCKLARKIPSFLTVGKNMLTIFDNIVSVSKRLQDTVDTDMSVACREWRDRHGRG